MTKRRATPDKSIPEAVALKLDLDVDAVAAVVDEFMLQVHRRAYEYQGLNGDYIGEELHYEMGPQGFYHFLRFLDWFSNTYGWENSSSEYLSRLRPTDTWMPYRRQMDGWVSKEHSRDRKPRT